MALNNRLVQNIDLQGDASALQEALSSIGTQLQTIVSKSGLLAQNLEKGGKAGQAEFNNTLKTIRTLISQATSLQNVLDGINSRRRNGQGLVDEQAAGRQTATISKLSRELSSTGTVVDALEKRVSLLNKRFAEIGQSGRSVSRNDLAKQLRIDEALKQVNNLQSTLTRLNGRALNTPSGGNSSQMAQLREQINGVNAALLDTAKNTRKSNFQPQIDQLRALVDQYQKLIALEIRESQTVQSRTVKANTTAQEILSQTDAQRLAAVQRASAQVQFPQGISNTVSQKAAEDQLTASLSRRVALLGEIRKAQQDGAPLIQIEKLNKDYKDLNSQIGEQYKLLKQVNAERARTPGTDEFKARATAQRSALMENLFGDGGLGFATRIAGASVITTGVFAVINAVQSATKFVVDYDAALKNLQAISGSTDTQMRVLADGIADVAKNSNYSTLEITKAAQTIAQAGYSAKETADVLKASITLSTAAGVDPQQGADVITSTLGAFQLQATEASRVSDVLVTALNRTKLSVDQVQAALQYAGATAKESGVSFDELTTVIASLAQAGIRSGSTIGTGLRQLLVDLQTPTDKFKKNLQDVGLTLADVDVKTKGFEGVVKTLAAAGFTASQAYESFETRAAASFLAFKNQLGTYDELALELARGGAAADAQAKAMDSLGSQFTRLTNDLGQVASGLAGPLVNALKTVTALFATMLEGIGALFEPLTELGGKFGVVSSILQVALFAGIGALFGPLGALAGLFIGLSAAVGGASASLDKLRTTTEDADATLTSQKQTITEVEDSINTLTDRQGTLKDGSVELQTATAQLSSKFTDLTGNLDKAAGSYQALLGLMRDYRKEAIGKARIDAQAEVDAATIEQSALRQKLNNGPTTFDRIRAGGVDPARLDNQGNRLADLANQGLQSNDANEVRAIKNQIAQYSAANKNILQPYITLLDQRLADMSRLEQLSLQIKNRTRDIGTYTEELSPDSQTRYSQLQNFRGQTNTAIGKVQQGDFGDATRLIDIAKRETAYLQDQITKAGGATSARGQSLTNDLVTLTEQLSRLQTAVRQQQENKPDKAAKGLNLTGTQVASDLRNAFPGINPYSYGVRSLATQQAAYAKYKAGKGPLAAKPGTSYHGTGNAVDITPLAGHSLDDIVAYVEGLGLEVVEALNERDPKTGRYHWHIAWKPKTSSFQRQQTSAFETLQRAAASRGVDAASSSIENILAQARAGTKSPEELRSRLSTATDAYKKAALNQYDTEHPATGLTGAALQEQQAGRAALVQSLQEKASKWLADLNKQIDDVSSKIFAAALQAIDDKLKTAEYNADAPVRNAQSDINIAGNNINAPHLDSGTSYYLKKQQANAQLSADKNKLTLEDTANAQKDYLIQQRQNELNNSGLDPNSEEYIGKQKEITTAQNQLNDAMQKTSELWQTIIDRTTQYDQLPLNQRLKEGIAAWADQSEVMKSFSDTLADNVGPALDAATNAFADMFTKVATGQSSIKSALAGMLQAIGQFVTQLIAKYLALQAIKGLLSLFGLALGTDANGFVTIGKQMTGGPAGKPMKLMSGGYISDGVRNRDSVPALLAQNEYVVRGQSVDSIGRETMDDINRHGQKAIDKMKQPAMMMGDKAHQEVNVWVVKPEQQPPVSKRDIVLAITDDMLQGGQTKQLVRQISQGRG